MTNKESIVSLTMPFHVQGFKILKRSSGHWLFLEKIHNLAKYFDRFVGLCLINVSPRNIFKEKQSQYR